MEKKSRPTIIVGNWKMYKTIEEAQQFVGALAPAVSDSRSEVYLSVPFTAIRTIADEALEKKIVVGAQNMNDAGEGAFTGEIAGKMLVDAGAKFVILGHSERRHKFNESNAFIHSKVLRALVEGIQPILCVGEKKEERDRKLTEEVLEKQLFEGLEGVTGQQLLGMIIAYEPVWAIGTGHTATPEQAQEVHGFCRKLIAERWGADVAGKVPILYGGSVTPDNARDLMQEPDIDGLLVGGASLSVEQFSQIVNYQNIMCH